MHASAFNSRAFLRSALRISFVVVALALPAVLLAQGYFGTVSGILTDPSGALIQGAKVTLTDEQKGFAFNATSDSSGRYVFVSIPPGLYSVTAEAPGFEKTIRKHIKLNVSENPTANLTLEIAGATLKIEVQAQSQSIATEDAVTGQVVDRRLINDLPLIDRYVMDLTSLAPGVTTADDQCGTNCTGTNFVSNGSRQSGADILMDGATVTNFEPNGGITNATYVPSPEAVEEFKLQQSNFSAEYGFSGASIVNVVTRSGTNSFHGGVYDFIRNTIGDANDWFADRAGQPLPPVHRHDFGFTIGGPIIKNKTFFFFDYEGQRFSNSNSYSAGVPSAAERTGDFGEVCGAAGGSFDSTGLCSITDGQLWDPYSGVYNSTDGGPVRSSFIPYNNIANYISPGSINLPSSLQPTPGVPGNLMDPVALKVLNSFPTANNQAQGIYNNWFTSGAIPTSINQFDLKIDHRFGAKNLVSGRYSQNWNHNTPFHCFHSLIDPCGGGANRNWAKVFTLTDAYTLSPTLLLDFTFGFTRGGEKIFAYDTSLNSNPLSALGFPSYLESNGFDGVPAMFIGDYVPAGFPNAGNDPYGNYKQGQDTGQLTVVLSKVRGPHELKFGFEGRLHQQNYIQTNAPLGFFSFDNTGSSLCSQSGISTGCPDNMSNTSGGDSMASFLMGQFTQNCASNGCGSNYEIQFQPATENYQYAWFVQDNWKVTPKLTLNLGLRYDVSLPRTDRFNHQNWFDPNATSPLNGGTISYTDPLTNAAVTRPLLGGEVFASPSHRTNYVTDWSDFQPRFGLAFQFSPKMVVRGGYGIYYGQSRSGASGVVPYGSAGFDEYTNVVTTYHSDGATPYLHLSNPFPNGLIQPAGSSLGLLNDVGFGANGVLRTAAANRTPQEQSWTLGVERQLPSNIVVSASYVGKKGTYLPFSGSNHLDVLGPWVENLPATAADPNNPCAAPTIPCLASYVNNPFSGFVTNPNSTLSNQQVQGAQLEVPYPQFDVINAGGVSTDVRMIANSIYHALQFTAEKHFSNGLEFLVNYTWSKSIDDSSVADDNVTWTGSFTSLQDPNKPWLERSLSTFDIPSVLKFTYSYDLPVGRGKALLGNMPRALDLLVGGWRTSGIWQIADGRPLTFTVSGGGKPIPTYGNQRPVISGKVKRNYGHDWQDQLFLDPNTAPTQGNPVGDILNVPAPYTLGNTPRAIADVRTPLSFTSDLSILKQFLLSSAHEGIRLEVRLEAQNAFNHPLFSVAGPNSGGTLVVGSTNFGVITQMSPVGPRQMQLAVKVNF